MLGAKDEPEKDDQPAFWSGLWALQLPSTSKTPAQVKDITRDKIGVDSHEVEWAEVEVEPREEVNEMAGKSHPGPRGYFASAALDSKRVVLWGGINAKGQQEPDGWVIDLKM